MSDQGSGISQGVDWFVLRHSRAHPTPHNLMPQYDRQLKRWQAPFDLVEFGMAYAARRHLDQNLAVAGRWIRYVSQRQRSVIVGQICSLVQQHRLHGSAQASRLARPRFADRA